jgi:hypothetical protein
MVLLSNNLSRSNAKIQELKDAETNAKSKKASG